MIFRVLKSILHTYNVCVCIEIYLHIIQIFFASSLSNMSISHFLREYDYKSVHFINGKKIDYLEKVQWQSRLQA